MYVSFLHKIEIHVLCLSQYFVLRVILQTVRFIFFNWKKVTRHILAWVFLLSIIYPTYSGVWHSQIDQLIASTNSF